MKVKKVFLFFVLLQMSVFIFPIDMETFYTLSPEDQVDSWLEEYQNDKDYIRRWNYQIICMYFTENENIPAIKPILFDRLSLLNIVKKGDIPHSLDMVVSICIGVTNFLTEEERFYLIPILQKKIDDYVSINKIIDRQVIYYTWIIDERLLVSWGDGHPSEINPYLLQKKYLDAGYTDITIDWEEIEARYHVPRKDYETY
jgi:hypothetical protein